MGHIQIRFVKLLHHRYRNGHSGAEDGLRLPIGQADLGFVLQFMEFMGNVLIGSHEFSLVAGQESTKRMFVILAVKFINTLGPEAALGRLVVGQQQQRV